MTDEETKEKIEELLVRGNKEMLLGNYKDAIRRYTEAFELDRKNIEIIYLRSSAYVKRRLYGLAEMDARKIIKINPYCSKAYDRVGLCFLFLRNWLRASRTFKDGLEKCPHDQALKKGLKEAEYRQYLRENGKRLSNYKNPFFDPMAMTKLRCNDSTKGLLEDEDFYCMVQRLCDFPRLMPIYQDKDERVKKVLGTLLLEDTEASVTEGGSCHHRTDLPKNTPPPGHGLRDPDNPYPEPMDTDAEKAVKEKAKGNDAYKSRDFITALKYYEKAIELDPSNIIYLLNLAAVYKEQGEYQKCAETSLKAVEVGRENRADYKQIAKAFARCALAYSEMEEFEKAKSYYEKSLSEHRTPETRAKLSEVEKTIKEIAEKAYRDPEKAEEERTRGNELFKKGDFPGAMKAYSEAIKRNPEDPKSYSNRAACYNKLAAFDLGIKDCDACIKIDPTFIKGHIRKGVLLKAMQQYDKAMNAFQKAIELDENNTEAIVGFRECMMCIDNDPDQVKKRALDDPEVRGILSDPGMRLILDQMQNNTDAAKEHMRNPDIAGKIQKLVQSGLIAFH